MLNLFIGVGRLTKDPELRKNANTDASYANFSLAFDNASTTEDGERGTTFLDAVAFNERAELIAKSLRKGSKVAVQGTLNQRDFLRKDGTKGRAYEIIVNTIEFLDPKPQVNDIDPNLLEAIEEEAKGSIKTQAQVEDEEAKPQAKFDPYTGKPLTKPAKKK